MNQLQVMCNPLASLELVSEHQSVTSVSAMNSSPTLKSNLHTSSMTAETLTRASF
ncbi:hypothetical protein ACCI51_17235 [Microbulbifer echini]|uniref:Uncharacterized protein n=1 Tax=Microbulbifer echini TaxID=1529067 RepID=A0ABV4NRV5_9GAMM|nr:hypothetical protein [uncultured Microbulbifer sp.]